MTLHEAVQVFKRVISAADQAESLALRIDGVRRINESTENTLDRLIRERRELVELIHDLGVESGPYDHYCKDYTDPVPRLRAWLKQNTVHVPAMPPGRHSHE